MSAPAVSCSFHPGKLDLHADRIDHTNQSNRQAWDTTANKIYTVQIVQITANKIYAVQNKQSYVPSTAGAKLVEPPTANPSAVIKSYVGRAIGYPFWSPGIATGDQRHDKCNVIQCLRQCPAVRTGTPSSPTPTSSSASSSACRASCVYFFRSDTKRITTNISKSSPPCFEWSVP